MVEYKVLRITDNGGSISVVVQIPSANKIIPICFNPQAFKVMTPEEVEHSVSDMVEQMYGGRDLAMLGGEESKVITMSKHFNLEDKNRPMINSSKTTLPKPNSLPEGDIANIPPKEIPKYESEADRPVPEMPAIFKSAPK